jgi:hypothetical protein
VQREITRHFTIEADYNAVNGSRLEAGLMNINQVPMSIVNSLISKYERQPGHSLLNANITSAAAVAAGFTPPYANFTNSAVQRSQTVNQSLRAFPQFLTVDAAAGGGDRTGHSLYNAGVLKVNYRAAGSLVFQGSYSFLQDPYQCRQLQRQRGRGGRGESRPSKDRSAVSIRTHKRQAQHRLRPALRQEQALARARAVSPTPSWAAGV